MQSFVLTLPFVFALACLLLLTRWVFKPSRPHTGRPDSGPGADLGMLRPVLTSSPRAQALSAKDRLSRQGIRCSVSRIEANSYDVLVFAPDADRATLLLAE